MTDKNGWLRFRWRFTRRWWLCTRLSGGELPCTARTFAFFWSYSEWLRGDQSLGWEILANIALFCPVGYLLAVLTPGKRSLLITAAAALLFSCCIEAGQWLSMRGMPETDDLMNNTLGR